MPNFEVFQKRAAPQSKNPSLTIQKSGVLALNRAAWQVIGEPTAVELLYDTADRIIGIRPVRRRSDHTYPVRNTPANPNQYLISGVAYIKFYEIEHPVSRRFAAYMEDGILCVDLKKPGKELVGNRNGKTNGASNDKRNPLLGAPQPKPRFRSAEKATIPQERRPSLRRQPDAGPAARPSV